MLILKNETLAEGLCNAMAYLKICLFAAYIKQNAFVKTVWPSGLRHWLKAPVRKDVGSNPTAVTWKSHARLLGQTQHDVPQQEMQIWQHREISVGGPTEILTGPCAT